MAVLDSFSLTSLKRLDVSALGHSALLWGLALLIGVAAALGAIAFRRLIEATQFFWYGAGGEYLYSRAATLPWWHLLLAPTLGGLAVGLLLRFMVRDEHLLSVADVIHARALKGARLALWPGLASAATTAVSLGTGASAGREGPVVHLGATLASFLSQRLKFPPMDARILLGCGVAAAVSASFNAPIAGVLFAHEVVLGHFAVRAFAPMAVASVVGTMIARAQYGPYPAFIIPSYELASPWEFPAFALLGIVCAVVAIAFMRSVEIAEKINARVPCPLWLRPAAGGLLVGAIAIFFPQVLGVGYESTDRAIKELWPLGMLLALIVAKTAATAITLASRFSGGVFSPSLYLGAMTGGAFGIIAAAAFPDYASTHGLYTTVGMGAVSAAVLGAPISTTLIVFELTGDYQLTLLLLVSVSIASAITRALRGKSFFFWQLRQRGYQLERGIQAAILQTVTVRDFMDKYEGTRDKLPPESLHLLPNDTLEHALDLMNAESVLEIPVIATKADPAIVGIARHRKALMIYNRGLIDAHIEAQR